MTTSPVLASAEVKAQATSGKAFETFMTHPTTKKRYAVDVLIRVRQSGGGYKYLDLSNLKTSSPTAHPLVSHVNETANAFFRTLPPNIDYSQISYFDEKGVTFNDDTRMDYAWMDTRVPPEETHEHKILNFDPTREHRTEFRNLDPAFQRAYQVTKQNYSAAVESYIRLEIDDLASRSPYSQAELYALYNYFAVHITRHRETPQQKASKDYQTEYLRDVASEEVKFQALNAIRRLHEVHTIQRHFDLLSRSIDQLFANSPR